MKKLLSRLGSASRRDVFYDAIDDEQPIGEPPDSHSDVGHMMNVILTRGESGLGLVFDENNVVTKLGRWLARRMPSAWATSCARWMACRLIRATTSRHSTR